MFYALWELLFPQLYVSGIIVPETPERPWLVYLPGEGRAVDRPVHQLYVGRRGRPPTTINVSLVLRVMVSYYRETAQASGLGKYQTRPTL